MSDGIGPPADVSELRGRLADALTTLKRIPAQGRSLTSLRSAWPDYLRNAAEAYGYTDASGGRQHAASADIARLDEVLGWISRAWSVPGLRGTTLPTDCGDVAWLRAAAGWPWPRIAARRRAAAAPGKPAGGNTPPSLRAIEAGALDHMLGLLAGARAAPAPVEQASTAEPALVWDVVVDRQVEEQVMRLRADGSALVRTRHARAVYREVPGRDSGE